MAEDHIHDSVRKYFKVKPHKTRGPVDALVHHGGYDLHCKHKGCKAGWHWPAKPMSAGAILQLLNHAYGHDPANH